MKMLNGSNYKLASYIVPKKKGPWHKIYALLMDKKMRQVGHDPQTCGTERATCSY